MNWLVVVAVGVVAALAVADALRPGPSSTSDTVPPATTSLTSAPGTTAASLSRDRKREIERIGNQWASLFAAGNARRCSHMTQPLCERLACERVGGYKIRNCTPPTAAFLRSFESATVQEVAIKGNRVAARFSNGEVVEFWGDGGTWQVDKVGGNAGRGFLE